MSEEKYHYFRDLDHNSNLEDGKSYHASGIAEVVSVEPTDSGKDLSVTYVHPFTREVEVEWRSYDEVELFDLDLTKLKFVI